MAASYAFSDAAARRCTLLPVASRIRYCVAYAAEHLASRSTVSGWRWTAGEAGGSPAAASAGRAIRAATRSTSATGDVLMAGSFPGATTPDHALRVNVDSRTTCTLGTRSL